jgi:hypothetical protein
MGRADSYGCKHRTLLWTFASMQKKQQLTFLQGDVLYRPLLPGPSCTLDHTQALRIAPRTGARLNITFVIQGTRILLRRHRQERVT